MRNSTYFEWLRIVIPLPVFPFRKVSTSFSSSSSISLAFLSLESEVAQPSSSIRPASRLAICGRSRGFKKRGWKMFWLAWGCKGTRMGRSPNVSNSWDRTKWYWTRPNPRPWRKTIGWGEVTGSHLAGTRSKYLTNVFKWEKNPQLK